MSKEHSPIYNKTKNAIDDFSMLKKGDRILVGFSGGKDSVALLCILRELSSLYDAEIIAFHVHHGIRGDEADRDLMFCKDFCEKHNIRFDHARVDAPKLANTQGIGLEEAARILRYNAFGEYANKNGITKIATAHSASDNAETVLFNLTRGSSAEGLRGIPPVRDNIIRPLIYCTADEIYIYVNENGFPYVFDSTNDDTEYTRNYVRKKVIPLLKAKNPEFENAVTRTCHTLRRDLDYIASNTKDTEDTASVHELSGLHDALLSRRLVSMYESTAGKTGALSFDHVTSMISLLRDERREGKKYVSLPQKIDFVITKDKAYFQKRSESLPNEPYEKKLEYGLNEFDSYGFDIFVCDSESEFDGYFFKNVYKMSIHTAVKKDSITDTITVRCRRKGDAYRYGNMTRKVKKIMNEKKTDADKRDTIPLFCDEKGIFWIPDFPLRDGSKPKGKESVLHLYYLERQ